jgi:hypothetical protein
MHSRFRPRLLGATIALVLGAIVAQAQSNPDLSGTWTFDAAKSDPGAATTGGGRGGGGTELVIGRSDTQLTVARGGQTFVYNLDGSEVPGPPGGETYSKMAWEGGKLVVTWRRQYYAGAAGFKVNTGRDVYTLNGNTLTVERTQTNDGAKPVTRTSVYTKS